MVRLPRLAQKNVTTGNNSCSNLQDGKKKIMKKYNVMYFATIIKIIEVLYQYNNVVQLFDDLFA